MILFGEEYLCKCNEEFDPVKVRAEFYKSLLNEVRLKQGTEDSDDDSFFYFYLPSEGRQVFTRWRWSYPNQINLKSKTFSIKYEKPLSTVDKVLLNNFRNKYLYHAIDDILYALKSKPRERDNLLAILYSPVFSLQNNFSIDFFDIWIDEVYIHEISKGNKFLANCNSKFEPFSYITIKLVYNKKPLPKKPESLW